MSISDTKKPISSNSDAMQTIAEMRFVSNGVGLVYDAQVKQLKNLANLFFHPATATISITQETRLVLVEVECKETSVTKKFPEAVQFVLGDSWTVQMKYGSPAPKKKKLKAKERVWKKKKR